MPTLHIEHAITELGTWLETVVWQSSDLSPALSGTPVARILDDVDVVT